MTRLPPHRGVTSQLREDIGPAFDDLRGPLSELQKLRGMTPRAALTKHLLDGDDSFLTGDFDRPALYSAYCSERKVLRDTSNATQMCVGCSSRSMLISIEVKPYTAFVC